MIYVDSKSSFTRNYSYVHQVLRVYICSYIPIYLLAFGIGLYAVFFRPEVLESETVDIGAYTIVAGFVLVGMVGPIVETMILVLLGVVGNRVFKRRLYTALFVGAAFSLMHGFFNVYWGVVQFWPFFFQGYLFAVRPTAKTAAVVAGAHMINNILVVGLFWMAETN